MAQSEILAEVTQAPARADTSTLVKPHTDNYRNLYVQTVNQHARSKGGQLWVASNPTSGTGIASHAAPTATDGTKPLVLIKNNYAVSTGKQVFVESIQIGVTVAGANATSSRFYVEKTAAGTERFSSGGSTNFNATTLALNFSGTALAATSAIVRLGAVVAATDANAKLLGEGVIRSIIPKVNDQIVLDFGDSVGQAGATLLDIANTGAVLSRFRLLAVTLEPGEQLLVHLVNAAQDAASSYTLKVVGSEG